MSNRTRYWVPEYLRTLRMLGIRISPWQHRACRKLELAGLKFCAHFGYGNAVELAKLSKAELQRRFGQPLTAIGRGHQ